MKVYMLVENDDFQLPLAVGDNLCRLSKALGKNDPWAYTKYDYQKKYEKNIEKYNAKTLIIEVEI